MKEPLTMKDTGRIERFRLKEFFNLKPGLKLKNQSEVSYHASLTPLWRTIPKWQRLHIEVGFSSYDKIPKAAKIIEPENSTNRHIYKPSFYFIDKSKVLYIHVHTPNILMHTLRSYAKALSHLNLKNNNPEVVIKKDETHYRKYINNWIIHKRVLVGRCESIINFITALHLVEKNYLTFGEAQEILLFMEKSRLSPQKMNDRYANFIRLAHKELRLKKQDSSSRVITSYNLFFRGIPITIIQLPWGTYMARQMVQGIFSLGQKITHLAIVGGVGYIGRHEKKVRIDEIFVPKKFLFLEEGNNRRIATIENYFWSLKENIFYKNKRVWSGTIFTITPKRQVISNSKIIKENKLPVDAVDMEFSAIYREVKIISPNTKTAYAYYIMDIPYQGLDLGKTYYDKKFLQKFFSNKNRGKYYCMEKMINFLTG